MNNARRYFILKKTPDAVTTIWSRAAVTPGVIAGD